MKITRVPTRFMTGVLILFAGGLAALSAQFDARFISLGGQRVHSTRILARFKDQGNPQARAEIAGREGLQLRRHFPVVPGLVCLDQFPGAIPANANAPDVQARTLSARIAILRRSGLFEFVEPDYVFSLQAEPTDTAFADGTLWGLRNVGQNGGVSGADIDAVRAWDITTGSSNVIVAVIDSGIRYTHQDLAANM
jgi:subtilisin family serine protease